MGEQRCLGAKFTSFSEESKEWWSLNERFAENQSKIKRFQEEFEAAKEANNRSMLDVKEELAQLNKETRYKVDRIEEDLIAKQRQFDEIMGPKKPKKDKAKDAKKKASTIFMSEDMLIHVAFFGWLDVVKESKIVNIIEAIPKMQEMLAIQQKMLEKTEEQVGALELDTKLELQSLKKNQDKFKSLNDQIAENQTQLQQIAENQSQLQQQATQSLLSVKDEFGLVQKETQAKLDKNNKDLIDMQIVVESL